MYAHVHFHLLLLESKIGIRLCWTTFFLCVIVAMPETRAIAQSQDRYDFFFRDITHFSSSAVDTCFQQWQCLPFPGYPSTAQRQKHHIASVTVNGEGYPWDESTNRWLVPSSVTLSQHPPIHWEYVYTYQYGGQLATVQWTQSDSSSQRKSQYPFVKKASYTYDSLGRIIFTTNRLHYICGNLLPCNWEYHSYVNQPYYETNTYTYCDNSTRLRKVITKHYYYPRENLDGGWDRIIYWTKSDYHYEQGRLQYIATHASTTDSLDLAGAVASGYTFFKYNRQHLVEKITTRNIEERGMADTLRLYGGWSFKRTAWIYQRNRLLRTVENHGFLDLANPTPNLKRVAANDLRSYFDRYFQNAPTRDLPLGYYQHLKPTKRKHNPLDFRTVNLMIREQISYNRAGQPHKSRGSTTFDATWTRSIRGYEQAFRVYGKGQPFLTRYVLQEKGETTAEWFFTAPNPELVDDGYQDPYAYLWGWHITKSAAGLTTKSDFKQEVLTQTRAKSLRRLRLRNVSTGLVQGTDSQLLLHNTFNYTFFQP